MGILGDLPERKERKGGMVDQERLESRLKEEGKCAGVVCGREIKKV